MKSGGAIRKLFQQIYPWKKIFPKICRSSALGMWIIMYQWIVRAQVRMALSAVRCLAAIRRQLGRCHQLTFNSFNTHLKSRRHNKTGKYYSSNRIFISFRLNFGYKANFFLKKIFISSKAVCWHLAFSQGFFLYIWTDNRGCFPERPYFFPRKDEAT